MEIVPRVLAPSHLLLTPLIRLIKPQQFVNLSSVGCTDFICHK
ncbi:hypothetical protein AG1IA_03755 [Rhizoctonia solani AG-1 IA]|uniref:Uncharacterized protein n=1 Tax=Thanatephorus cucumeris (strain AG1-IA) TaxID=983506 RepID=L8WZK2_THACA|nr:hypothetical protein AG1IA_03755 [Rhizoctonia solani AG-1 IA]